jgi:hypothetical protein
MQRVWVLAGLMVLVLGASVVAQSPSPEATQPYAPDDITSALPSSLDVPGPYFVDEQPGAGSADAWRDLLRSLGKDPDDMHAASGIGYYRPEKDAADAGAPIVFILAYRIEGVAAIDIMPAALRGLPSNTHDWVDIDGRTVSKHMLIRESDDATSYFDTGIYVYPNGEVLYVILMPADIWYESGASEPIPPALRSLLPTIEDVLAELP